jgi:18S rRNA (guanine1575-N7)-methyltransferase
LNKADKSKLFKKKGKKILKRKEVVLKRKERLRRKGKVIKPDTKYTGRRRKPKF